MNKFNCRLDIAEQRIKLEDKQISHDTSYLWNLKKSYANELIYKTKIDSPSIENGLRVTKGEGGEGYIGNLGFIDAH